MTRKTTEKREEFGEQELRAGHLDDQQLARAEACDRARAVLAQKSGGFAPGSSSVDAMDLINVASWIIDGVDPWADQVDSDDVDQLARVAKAIRECRDAIGRVIPGFWNEIPGDGYIEQCADLGAGPFSTAPADEPTFVSEVVATAEKTARQFAEDLGIDPDAPIPPGRTVVVSAEDRAEVDSDDQPCPECGLGQTTPHSQHGQPDDDGDDQIGSVTA